MTSDAQYCVVCHAPVEPGKPCWLCKSMEAGENVFAQPLQGASLGTNASHPQQDDNPYATPTPIGDSPTASAFSIVLVVGVIIVLVALTVAAPGLGILLAIIVAPAVIRTAVVAARHRQVRQQDLSVSEKSTLFLASFGGALLAATAAGVAFGVTCAATCFGVLAVGGTSGNGNLVSTLFIAALGLSCIVGLTAGGYTLHRLWRSKT